MPSTERKRETRMAIEVNQAIVVQWGCVGFHLDNVAFSRGFLHGHEYSVF
jgi:hypothetical protein